MKLFAPFVLFLSAFWVSSPAYAQNVSAANPESVVKALQDAGYRADLDTDTIGDPMITSSSSGRRFVIFFYGCTDNRDCTTLEFYAGFSEPRNGTIEAMNDWNANNRFGRGYRSDSGSARVEMDVNLDDGGVSPELFEDTLELWVAVMNRFYNHIYP